MKNWIKILLAMIILIGIITSFSVFNNHYQQAVLQSGVFPDQSVTNLEQVIIKSLKSSSSTEIIPYLEEDLTVSILDKEDFYNPSTTGKILEEFMNNHPPKKVYKKHSGASKSGKGAYLIIHYVSNANDEFRCTFNMSQNKIKSIEITRDAVFSFKEPENNQITRSLTNKPKR